MDAISEQRLAEVYPALADKIRAMCEVVTIRVTQGLRTYAEQDALYQQGRTLPGRIVTDAPPGSSWHNFGLAIDIVPMTELGPDWNRTHPVWQHLVQLGTASGLVAGAQFRTFPDWPHFQLTGAFPVTPNDEVRAAYEQGGIQEVWRQAFEVNDVAP